MLSKEICKKCWSEGWGENDDRYWIEIKQVECEVEPGVFRRISINAPPPTICEYKLEHAVAAGMVVSVDKRNR